MKTSGDTVTWGTFAPRDQKALKIRSILADFLGEERLHRLRCLDIGCGTGEISRGLAGQTKEMFALDYVFNLIHTAAKREPPTSVHFLQADGVRLPFGAASFDLIICAQLYEHMAQAERLPVEIQRVLRPGGICFFSGPNKVWPIEPHYRLPFLHWLPRRLAALYLRLSSRGEEFTIQPYSYWRLRQLWEQFVVYDQTLSLLDNPDRIGLSGLAPELISLAPTWLFRALYFMLPNYNWILLKPDEE
ncbi:MAG: class I SAM-dependent methyltransferase [Chloroflexota bacterium]|nr:class I SAM-dependent methyltransferase [Chloroflexota bacterium]